MASLAGFLGPGATTGLIVPIIGHKVLYLATLVFAMGCWLAACPPPGPSVAMALGNVCTGILLPVLVNRFVFLAEEKEETDGKSKGLSRPETGGMSHYT